MPPAGIKPAFPASERPQNQALDRATTAIDLNHLRSTVSNSSLLRNVPQDGTDASMCSGIVKK